MPAKRLIWNVASAHYPGLTFENARLYGTRLNGNSCRKCTAHEPRALADFVILGVGILAQEPEVADVLTRIVNDHLNSQIDDLLPLGLHR